MKMFASERSILRSVGMLCALGGLIFTTESNLAEPIRTRITLPIEIMGADGSVGAVSDQHAPGLSYPSTFAMVTGTWVGAP